MHPLVPPFILQNDRAGVYSGSLQAAVLFVDASGFTALTEALSAHGSHGAEVLAQVITATFEPLFRSVCEQGGWVSSQEGDAFTALFPGADSPEAAWRAFSAAVQIQEYAAGHALHATPYGEFRIRVKVGLACGEVSWAILRSEDGQRAAYFFRGAAVERSTAAEGMAAAGEVWLDESFQALVRDRVQAEPSGGAWRLQSYRGETAPALPVELPQIDLDLAARYHPRELFRWTASGEFRRLAHLFVSLPTIRTETQLAIFMQTLFSLQDRYGGLLDRVGFGDKGPHLLLFWGAPLAHENDLERLLNFILDLQAQTAIPINGGVTYSLAHAGFVGSELAESFAPFGPGVNLAARFMTTAPRGEIWLDEAVARRAGQHFLVEENGAMRFKGFAAPQKVFVLVDRKEEEDQLRGGLQGREDELREMEDCCLPIFAGRCAGALVLWGEPGMGKSSLARELERRLQAAERGPFQFAVGQSDEILRQPFNPFRYWLRHAFQVSESQGESRNKRSFNRGLDELIAAAGDPRLADELDRTRSFLGALLNLFWADSLYEQLDAKGRYENTILALSALLQAESLRRPLIFLIEDAHWLDEDSRALLPRLLRALDGDGRSYPALLLITARPDPSAALAEGFAAREISLARLSRAALAALAQAQLGGPPGPDLLALLEERAEGNPFFCEQTLRYLQEEDLLAFAAGAWQVRRRGELSLPADVGSLLVARLDRLESEVKEVVQTASILGREFDRGILRAMLPGQADLEGAIQRAQEEQIWDRLGEARLSFRHVLLRDAAYQMQVLSRRAALHRLAYETLRAAPDAPGSLERLGELAYHAEQAGLRGEAVHYLELSGQGALGAYQNSQAEEHFTRALGLAAADDLEKRCALLLGRETSFEIQGKPGRRQEDLDELERLSAALENSRLRAGVLVRRANFLVEGGAYEDGARLAREALELAQQIGADETAIAARKCLATAAMRRGDYAAAGAEARQGLELAGRAGSRHEEGMLWNNLGLIALEQGSLESARGSFARSLEIARQAGNIASEAPALNNLGMIAGMQGDTGAMRRYYEQALEIARKTGSRFNEGLVLGNLGWHAGSTGDYSRARAYGEQFLRVARETGNLNGEVYSLINLSAYAVALADTATALAQAGEAIELARRLGDRSAEAWARTYQGQAWLETGQAAQAAGSFQSALDIRVELEQPVLALEPRAGLALAALAQGDPAAALREAEAILSHLAQGSLEGTEEPLRVYLACYQTLRAAGDARRAGAILEEGRIFLLERAAKIQDETARQIFLENIPAHRELLALCQGGG